MTTNSQENLDPSGTPPGSSPDGSPDSTESNFAAGSNAKVRPCVIWFTGLPSSGKTTLCLALSEFFHSIKSPVEHLDGDAVRAILPGIGFSRDDRNDHIRRMGFLASRLEHHGIPVIASFVSPYRESRDFVRSLCKSFVEIHLSTDLKECSTRDVKGLYKEASSGKKAGLTGVDDPYEPPLNPELVLDTKSLTKEECLERIKQILKSLGLLELGSGSNTCNKEDHGSHIASRAR